MLLTEAQTLDRVLGAVEPLGAEVQSRLLGRVLAEDVFASIPLPAFDNSSMDGYAVRAADAKVGGELAVIGEHAAGADRNLVLGPGQTVRIFTGAPIPNGADAVIMQEDVERRGDKIVVREGVERGENIRIRGGDLCEGQRLASKGEVLTPARIAVIGSQGIAELSVYRRPTVAVIATGSELRPQGERLRPSEIYETNRILLASLTERSNAVADVFDIVPDTEEAHLKTFEQARSRDVMLIAGGMSVGEKDLVRPMLKKLGAELDLWRVAIKPGKPFLFGRLGRTLVFGLPGNPVSAFVTFLLFVRPALWKMGGRADLEPLRIPARLASDLSNDGDRPHYFRGVLKDAAFQPMGLQQSHALFALSQANALCRVESERSIVSGSVVDVLLLE
jgi:molybdopterin molybdotransferase